MKKKEIAELKRFFELCRICGNADVWRYGNASYYHNCRECYRSEEPKKFLEYLDIAEREHNSRPRRLKYEKLKREYYRTVRNKNGIFEPIISCKKCKTAKPLFEFPHQGLLFILNGHRFFERLLCYDCLSLEERKQCCRCLCMAEKEDFEDEGHIYKYCLICRTELAEKQRKEDEEYLNTVKISTIKTSLILRGWDITEENIEFMREFLLAKRIKNKLKYWRIDYESNHSDVYGKQLKDEKNNGQQL